MGQQINDMEKTFKNADFSAGSDHKERLRKMLFSGETEHSEEAPLEELRDEELDMAAGGKKTDAVCRIY